jgi:8-oxo-dGTP pyrophosphatase MutT (NUDIX family)
MSAALARRTGHSVRVPVSPYIRRMRASVGSDLLLLPSVTVLPRDADGRVLLVGVRGSDEWMTIGGMVEPDEDPAAAAIREAQEEAGVTVELDAIVGALGGPRFRLRYPNGDQTAYVTIVYAARVVAGVPRPDGDETDRADWFSLSELLTTPLTAFAIAQFEALGMIAPSA